MTLLELMKHLISANDLPAIRALCERLALVEDELFKLGCSLAYPKLIDDLLDHAFIKPTSFAIIRALVELDPSPEVSAHRLVHPKVLSNELWVDGLLQMGIRLTPTVRQSAEYHWRPIEVRNTLEAKHQLLEVIKAVQTPPGILEWFNHARAESIKGGLAQCANLSSDVLGHFVNEITFLRSDNPLSEKHWAEFKTAIRALPAECAKKISPDQLEEYSHPGDPKQRIVANTPSLSFEHKIAITAKAQEIKNKLGSQANNDDEDVPLKLLAWYFVSYNKTDLTLPEIKKMKQAREILAKYKSLFDYYCTHPENLVNASFSLDETQKSEAVTLFSELCAQLLCSHENTSVMQNKISLPFLKPRRPKWPLLATKLADIADPIQLESILAKVRGLEAGLVADGFEISLGILTIEEFMLNAVSKHFTGMVAHLLSKGANVNAKQHGKTALMISAIQRDMATCSLLVSHSDIDLNAVDDDNMTALMHALKGRHTVIAEFLMQQPTIDVNVLNRQGENALIFAINQSILPLKLIKHILDKTDQPNLSVFWADNQRSCTVVKRACDLNNPELLDLLLKCDKVDPNIADSTGVTPLQDNLAHQSLEWIKGIECAMLLLSHPKITPLEFGELKKIYKKIPPEMLQLIVNRFNYSLSDLEGLYQSMSQEFQSIKMGTNKYDAYSATLSKLKTAIVKVILQDQILLTKRLFKADFQSELATFIASNNTDLLLINKACAADSILWVKQQIINRSGVFFATKDSELINRLKNIIILDAKLLCDYSEAMMTEDKNPFDAPHWTKFTELLTAAFNSQTNAAELGIGLLAKIKKYTHPSVVSGANLGEVMDGLNRSKNRLGASSSLNSPIVSPRDKLNEDIEMTIRNCIKEDFQNQIMPEKPTLDMLNALETLWVDKANSPDTFLKQQEQQQSARAFLKKCGSNLETYLDAPKMMGIKLRSQLLPLALNYLKTQLSVAIEEQRQSLLSAAAQNPPPVIMMSPRAARSPRRVMLERANSPAQLMSQVGLMPAVPNGEPQATNNASLAEQKLTVSPAQ